MRRDQQRLNDIVEALDWIAKGIAGRTEADFLAMRRFATPSPKS